MDLIALLNTVTAALLLGAGKLLLDVRTLTAVHDRRLDDHEKDIQRLTERPQCPHL